MSHVCCKHFLFTMDFILKFCFFTSNQPCSLNVAWLLNARVNIFWRLFFEANTMRSSDVDVCSNFFFIIMCLARFFLNKFVFLLSINALKLMNWHYQYDGHWEDYWLFKFAFDFWSWDNQPGQCSWFVKTLLTLVSSASHSQAVHSTVNCHNECLKFLRARPNLVFWSTNTISFKVVTVAEFVATWKWNIVIKATWCCNLIHISFTH